MKNEFDTMIKELEDEILALKTASKYSSIRSTQFFSSFTVTTGLYRINYNTNGNAIFSIIYGGVAEESISIEEWGKIYARTPTGNTQVIEVNNDYFDGEWHTVSTTLVVLSNFPVTSITRIS